MAFIRNCAISSILFLPFFAGPILFLLNTAFFYEVAFLPLYESADEDVALMDECDGNVGDSLVGTFLYLFPEDGRVEMCLAERTSLHASWVVIRLLFQSSHTQIVLIVEK